VALALIVLRTVFSVEVVNPDGIGSICASEEVPSITEFNFFAGFDLEGAWLRRELLAQYIVNRDLVN
jgi:hypothetical protein